MSFRRIKAGLMTAACSGLFGASSLFAADTPAPMPAPAAHDHTHAAPVVSHPTAGCNGCSAAPTASYGAPAGDCGYTTVKTIEYVKEMVPETRTTYKQVWKDETYTVNKTEMVQETRTRQVTVMKPITETVMVNKTITKKVPVTKTVTVMESHWETQHYTEMKTKRVRKVHYTQECVEKKPGLCDRLKGLCDPCYDPCPTYEMECKKHCTWETECYPVTKCKKVKVCTPVCKQVCSYECVTECIQVPCTTTKCVPECKTETYTVCVPKCTPVTCTRKVCTTVPCTETVMVCKMVPKCVEKQVPISTGLRYGL